MKKLSLILGIIALIAIAGFSTACKTEEDSAALPPPATANTALYTTWYLDEECTESTAMYTFNSNGDMTIGSSVSSYKFTATATTVSVTTLGVVAATFDYAIADKVLTISNSGGPYGSALFPESKYYCK